MTYQLGIDLGTTFSTAAVLREGRAEVLSLGTRSSAVPTVVLVRDDGVVLVGESAEARGVAEPDRVAREFKRRLGDPTPLVLGGAPYGAERLAAYVLEHVIEEAYSDPELVRSAPHNQAIDKVDVSRADDPEYWATTWRAYQRKRGAAMQPEPVGA